MPPTDLQLHEVSRAIGELQGRVDILQDIVAEEQKTAGNFRFDMRKSVEALHNQMTVLSQSLAGVDPNLKSAVADLVRRVSAMEPEVKEISVARIETRGKVYVLRAILVGAASLGGYMLTKFEAIIEKVFRH